MYDFNFSSIIKQECHNEPLFGKLVCFFCDKEFPCKEDLQSHQDQCALRSPALQSLLTKTQNNRGEKLSFLGAFGLVPKGRTDFLKSDKRNDVIVDIIVIDDDSDDEIKQTSCEKSSRYLLSPTRRDSSDSESIDKLRTKKMCSVRNTLGIKKNSSIVFKIDLSSPLGVRLRYHSKVIDSTKPLFINRIIENYDDYCGKLSMQMAERLSWNEFFPVTFKKSRLFSSNYCRFFKFTRKELREFCTEISRCRRTGLCLRARRLKGRMKPCSVLLERMDLSCEDGKLIINQTFTIAITDTVNSKLHQNYYKVIDNYGTRGRNVESEVLSGFQQNPVGLANNQISSIDMKTFLSSNQTNNPRHVGNVTASNRNSSFVSFIGNLTETARHYPKSMAFIPMPLFSCRMPPDREDMLLSVNDVQREKSLVSDKQISLHGGMSSTNNKNISLSEKIAFNDIQVVSQRKRSLDNETSPPNDNDDLHLQNRMFQISSVYSLATNQKNNESTLMKKSKNHDNTENSVILSSKKSLFNKNSSHQLVDGEVINLSDGESRQSSKENTTGEHMQPETSGQVKDVSDKVCIIDLTENVSSVHEPLQNSTLVTSEEYIKAQRYLNMQLSDILLENDEKMQVSGRLQSPTNFTQLLSKQTNIREKVAETMIPPNQLLKPNLIEILDEDSMNILPESRNAEILSVNDEDLSVSHGSPNYIAVAQRNRNLQERNVEFTNRKPRPLENASVSSGNDVIQRSILLQTRNLHITNQNLLPSENVPMSSRITNDGGIVQRKDKTKDYSSGDMIDLSIDSDCETIDEDCTEIRDELASNGLKRVVANSSDSIPIKRKKTNGEVMLENSVLGDLSFKCHICGSLFNLDANASVLMIQSHYSTHNVTNIKVVQKRLPDGQFSWNLVELDEPNAKAHSNLDIASSVSSSSGSPRTGTTLPNVREMQHQRKSKPTFISSSSQHQISPSSNVPASGTSPLIGQRLQAAAHNSISPDPSRPVTRFSQRPLLSTVMRIGNNVHTGSSSRPSLRLRQQYNGSDQYSTITSCAQSTIQDIPTVVLHYPNKEMSLPQQRTISSHDRNNYILHGQMTQPVRTANGRYESPTGLSHNATTSSWNNAARLVENLQQSAIEKDPLYSPRIVSNKFSIPINVESHRTVRMEDDNGTRIRRNIDQTTNRSNNTCVSVIPDVNNVICLD